MLKAEDVSNNKPELKANIDNIYNFKLKANHQTKNMLLCLLIMRFKHGTTTNTHVTP